MILIVLVPLGTLWTKEEISWKKKKVLMIYGDF